MPDVKNQACAKNREKKLYSAREKWYAFKKTK